MPFRTKLYVVLSLVAASAAMVWSLQFRDHSWLKFLLFLLAVLLSSGFKVMLPRGDGTMSLDFPFILLAAVQLSPRQAMLLAGLSVATQFRLKVRKMFTAAQMAFNIASAVVATGAACATLQLLSRSHLALAPALQLAALTYFLCSTGSVAAVIASSSGEHVFSLWKQEFAWYLPFYLVGALLAAVTDLIGVRFGWATSLLLLPVVYTLYRTYNEQRTRLQERQQHLEETRALHHRTIEGLSMAIEAKDQNTHEHLFRVRNYVEEVGKKLGLCELDLQALHTAAFLHDIGKLAVPEHIINKPGRLTPEEFEKMKIHPVVGADILERVRFPYPVVPIVRSHHEWWNGTGYPDGLKGTDIPIGARVLSAVDCFDALISDRPYRKGMPARDALAFVKRMSGTQFDPAVVAVIESLYNTGSTQEQISNARNFTALNTDIEVWRGEAPGAGFEEDVPGALALHFQDETSVRTSQTVDSLHLIAAASQEAQALFEMNQSLGVSLSLSETISVVASRLRRLIPFDSCALFVKVGDALTLRYVDGENAKSFSGELVTVGEGISGWVAQSGKSILNGNPALESNYKRKFGCSGELRSALSIPLFDLQKEVFGVLTLYSIHPDKFLRDHLRILLAMGSKLSMSLQNAMQYRRAESDAETDFLTGLPNARRLFLQLEKELERCRANDGKLGVVVCDLDRFKDVNDQRGHLAGNRLLSLVAEEFRANCRSGDTVARMGGDEFVFLIRDLDERTTDERLENIAAQVREASRRAGLGVQVTASVGLAFFPAQASTAEDLLALADRNMYADKKASSEVNVLSMPAPAGKRRYKTAVAV